MQNNRAKPRRKLLGFLLFKKVPNTKVQTPLSKQFLRRYKKLNKKDYEISKLTQKK
jgi:hypothetical protein